MTVVSCLVGRVGDGSPAFLWAEPQWARCGLVDGEGQGGGDETDGADDHADDRVGLFFGEQGDGAEDDGDLQEGFAEIVVGGFALGEVDLVFELAGVFLELGKVVVPAREVGSCSR